MEDSQLSEKAVLRPLKYSSTITSGSSLGFFLTGIGPSVDSCLSFQLKNGESWSLSLIRTRTHKASRQDHGCRMNFGMPPLTGMLLIMMLNTCGDGGLSSFHKEHSAHCKLSLYRTILCTLTLLLDVMSFLACRLGQSLCTQQPIGANK